MSSNNNVTPLPKKQRKYDKTRLYWYMVAVEIDYVEETTGKTPKDPPIRFMKSLKMNLVVQSKWREITATTLGDIKGLVLMRMEQQYKIDPAKLANYVVLNIMLMGHMSEHDHFTRGVEKVDVNTLGR